MNRVILCTAAALMASTSIAAAEFQFSAYGGWQTAPHSLVTVTGANPDSFTAGWEGKSFQMPPYYGVRATWWMDHAPAFGVSLDFTHAKVYADDETLAEANGWDRFEFSDGINILTVNGMYRYQKWGKFEPYAGIGVGLSIPHVEVTRDNLDGNGPQTTFEYQIGGAAFQTQIGANYKLTDRFSVFGEYKFNYTMNDVTIDGGDSLKTNIITNAFVAGVSVHF